MLGFINKVSNLIWGIPFVLLIGGISIYLSFKYKFPQLKILYSFKELFKKSNFVNRNDKITSFKSLMTVLAGTIGTGNITGVALAILIGGVGSLFWLFLSGIFAIIISYTENIIVLKNRGKNKKGYYGGAMYVLDDVLDKKNIAIFFSVAVILVSITTGTMTQSNSISTLLNASLGVKLDITGVILSIFVFYIMIGGKQRLAKVSSILVPICSVTYISLCFYIMVINRANIISGVLDILKNAFNFKEIAGGIAGLSLNKVIGKGFSCGMFSNEAGMGSAPIFTATVEENNIEMQANIAATSVVVDTLILCMITGLTIVSAGGYNQNSVSQILNLTFGSVPYGNIILNFCMIFFVISTIPCWEYYGEVAVKYLFNTNGSIYLYRIFYVFGIFIGSIINVNFIWEISEIFNAMMALPNLYMIYKYTKDDLHFY